MPERWGHMSDKWDTIFEATQQDGWWMPKSVIQVSRADIRYTYDTSIIRGTAWSPVSHPSWMIIQNL